jgi:hypothetical protein
MYSSIPPIPILFRESSNNRGSDQQQELETASLQNWQNGTRQVQISKMT